MDGGSYSLSLLLEFHDLIGHGDDLQMADPSQRVLRQNNFVLVSLESNNVEAKTVQFSRMVGR